ncbi:hypothetical protein LCGC14_1492910 [marine sediment metagenome]|uniref:Uncharacterized protein n=1 Tax=marine sediment metagenome TaxID=412755 RepID=A0A0F9JS79_9ZZZZ
MKLVVQGIEEIKITDPAGLCTPAPTPMVIPPGMSSPSIPQPNPWQKVAGQPHKWEKNWQSSEKGAGDGGDGHAR